MGGRGTPRPPYNLRTVYDQTQIHTPKHQLKVPLIQSQVRSMTTQVMTTSAKCRESYCSKPKENLSF